MNGIERVDEKLFELDSRRQRIRRCLVVVNMDREEEDPQPCRLW